MSQFEEIDIIDDILDNFDFERVKKTMDALDWAWFSTGGIPSVSDIRREARRLLRECMKTKEIRISTGGLTARREEIEGKTYYSLEFVVTEWDNSY